MSGIIIPNWHPIFVNFTVALFTVAVGFYGLGRFIYYKNLSEELLVVARWCLWLSALSTVATIALGFYAYYTVAHDPISHSVMEVHRNWAMITAVAILVTAIWSFFTFRKQGKPRSFFLMTLLVTFGLLVITAWHGAELVFRYGIGVVTQPIVKHNGDSHENNHGH